MKTGFALIIAGALAGLPLPALAQAAPAASATPPATTPPPAEKPDAAKLAAARPVVDKLWPLGTYRRMMDGTMSKMMDGMMQSMFDMRAADVVGTADRTGEAAKAVGDKSLGEVATSADPHFRERMKITMDTMMTEMIPLMERMEPSIRDNLTSIYARKFTTAQLGDMNAFFSTPSGAAYARESMMLLMDPEMMQSMQSFVPELLKAMPDIMAKVEKATAHLPPPPKPKEAADAE